MAKKPAQSMPSASCRYCGTAFRGVNAAIAAAVHENACDKAPR